MFNNTLRGVSMAVSVLRLPTVKERTGLSRSTIYLRMANNEFPRHISLGGRAVGWLESDIDEWIFERIEQSRINDHGQS